MATSDRLDQIRGRTIRFSWSDGPTQGTTHEHVFHADGTVEWHSVDDSGRKAAGAAEAAGKDEPKAERPRYSSIEVTGDFWLVSYLSSSGYTLTVMLNFEDGSIVGIASNETSWFQVRGRFVVVR
jgi:hypothetical protein